MTDGIVIQIRAISIYAEEFTVTGKLNIQTSILRKMKNLRLFLLSFSLIFLLILSILFWVNDRIQVVLKVKLKWDENST